MRLERGKPDTGEKLAVGMTAASPMPSKKAIRRVLVVTVDTGNIVLRIDQWGTKKRREDAPILCLQGLGATTPARFPQGRHASSTCEDDAPISYKVSTEDMILRYALYSDRERSAQQRYQDR